MEGPSKSGAIRFGVYELDVRSGELRRDGIRIRLQEQPFQILQILLGRPGEIVTREELRQTMWASDTFVDFDHGINNAIKRLRAALSDSAERPTYVETVASRGYRFIARVTTSPGRIQSLAVLPLENLSRDPEQDYFAEGLTEALITTLVRIGDLRVVSRTTVMLYKHARKPIQEIAQELDVAAIVEGTVLRVGQRVRITAQLTEATSETHLWAGSYERDLRDVLALQAEVAQAIAREVQVKLTAQERAQIAQAPPVEPEAYEAYLKARYHWNRRPAELREAIKYSERAVAKAPTYAAAYALLAHCLSLLKVFGLGPTDGFTRAKALAQKALELDHSLAEAHVSLAVATMYDYDFLAAENEFERSIELNPRHATAHQDFGLFLGMMGRYEESYTELQRAIRLDPLSSVIQATLGFVYIYARRYDPAIEQFEKTLALDPNSGLAQNGLGWAYRCKSLYQPAISALRKGLALWPGSTPIAWLGETYAAAGSRDDAQKILQQLHEFSRQRYVTPYGVARIYAALGNRDEALRLLEMAYQQRAEWMLLLKVDACFDDLRFEPRFRELLQRMKFST